MNESIENGTRKRGRQRARSESARPSERRGSVTVTVALTMTALIGLLALGIDLGALFNARSEAQRAADAAALAGASAFLEYQQSQARQAAVDRATEFATNNELRNEPITAEEISVWVDLDSSTVRAAVHRDEVSTWFARILGIDAVEIGAEATAWAGAAGAAQCLRPFAVPDMWEETSDDSNGNRIWDAGERWSFDPEEGDRYAGYSGVGGGPNETGYGSGWRDGQVDAQGRQYQADYGRRIRIKVTNPRNAYVPSFFLPWVLPSDPDQPECGSGRGGPGSGGGNAGGPGGSGGGDDGGEGGDGVGDDPAGPEEGGGGPGWVTWWKKREGLGVPARPNPPNRPERSRKPGAGPPVDRNDGGGKGAARYRRNICTCNRSIVDLDTEYLIEPGNMVGPTFQGVQALIARDPDAYWDDGSNTVVSEYGMDSPRVVTVALFDPGEITKPGRQYLRFNNFARIFIEEQASRRDPVTGRFLYYVRGVGPGARGGETTGSLVRTLQLIR